MHYLPTTYYLDLPKSWVRTQAANNRSGRPGWLCLCLVMLWVSRLRERPVKGCGWPKCNSSPMSSQKLALRRRRPWFYHVQYPASLFRCARSCCTTTGRGVAYGHPTLFAEGVWQPRPSWAQTDTGECMQAYPVEGVYGDEAALLSAEHSWITGATVDDKRRTQERGTAPPNTASNTHLSMKRRSTKHMSKASLRYQ